MAHRHPSKLNAEHVAHPSARRLLKAELANCAECRARSEEEALATPEVLASLLHGFALKRAAQWRDRHSRYPSALHDLAPPAEVRFLTGPTREIALLCIIGSRSGDRVDTAAALDELDAMTGTERSLVLSDLIDGLLEDEG
ncbi:MULTISPECIES: hypothetical protein [Nocardiopsis]|uniref:hypothetical protein n=1 Tax=Nocardiopsis TaxID=2013 RepID=UPI00034DB334|nr:MULTISPECIES: hypothetical protein [Nocardiopsis]